MMEWNGEEMRQRETPLMPVGLPVILMRNRPTYQITVKTNAAANKHPKMVKSLQKLVGGFQREWDYQITAHYLLAHSFT
jgi:hypothetical protein